MDESGLPAAEREPDTGQPSTNYFKVNTESPTYTENGTPSMGVGKQERSVWRELRREMPGLVSGPGEDGTESNRLDV